jgi:hypothetical protein
MGFPQLIIFPQLLYIHPSPSFEAADSPDRAARRHILGLQAGGFICDVAFGWQGSVVCRKLLCQTN